MNSSQNLQVNDPKFFQKSVHHLTNFDVYLRPLYNDVLEYRCKSNFMRVALSGSCIPMLMASVHSASKEDTETTRCTQELRKTLDEVDKELYQDPLHCYLKKS